MAEKPDKETIERWRKDPANWKYKIFYYNLEDERLLPIKRWGLGWTVNFANPYSVFAGMAIPIITVFLIRIIFLCLAHW